MRHGAPPYPNAAWGPRKPVSHQPQRVTLKRQLTTRFRKFGYVLAEPRPLFALAPGTVLYSSRFFAAREEFAEIVALVA